MDKSPGHSELREPTPRVLPELGDIQASWVTRYALQFTILSLEQKPKLQLPTALTKEDYVHGTVHI